MSPTPRIRRSAHPIGGFPSAQCITNRVPAAWRARMIVKSGYSGKMWMVFLIYMLHYITLRYITLHCITPH